MNKKNLFSLLPLVVMVMLTISLFSCGGDDDNSPNGGGSYDLVDGVHVNPQKLLALDVYKGENAKSKIHFDMSYDAKGRLTDVIASVYRTLSDGNTQTDKAKILSIDYDLRFIEYYHKEKYSYNSTTHGYDVTPVYERAFFNLNSNGYIATLDNCELSYNNDGYLVGKKDSKTMWTFAYGENDVIKYMVERLKTGNIDIYFSVDAARAFCHDILSGKLCKLAQREKERCAKSGEQYPKEVYISPLGGTTEEKAKERNLRTDGKAISRLFKLSPGSKADFVFTAEQRPGHTDKNKGIIIPEGGKPEVLIRVSCTKEQLKELALALQEHMLAFTTSQYVHNGYARQQKKK